MSNEEFAKECTALCDKSQGTSSQALAYKNQIDNVPGKIGEHSVLIVTGYLHSECDGANR